MTSAIRSRNVNVVAIISDRYTTVKPFGQDFYPRIHKLGEKIVVPDSEKPKAVFSLIETVKLSVSISPRNLYISLESIKESSFLKMKETNISQTALISNIFGFSKKLIVLGQVYTHLNRLKTKPTKWHVRPAKTQISLGICPVRSESSLFA